jgi:hypothetical protein
VSSSYIANNSRSRPLAGSIDADHGGNALAILRRVPAAALHEMMGKAVSKG